MAIIYGPRLSSIPITFLLDDYSGSNVAIGVIVLSSDFVDSPIIRVRRSGDNNETDVYANGSYVIAADSTVSAGGDLETWADGGSGNVFITTMYDQSGNGNDASIATSAYQPQIIASDVFQTSNGITHADYLSFSRLYFDSSIAVTQEYYALVAFERASTGIDSIGITSGGSAAIPLHWNTSDNILSRCQSVVAHELGDTSTGNFIFSTFRDSSDNTMMTRNGIDLTTKTNAGATSNFTSLGYGGPFTHVGGIHAMVHWDSDQESNNDGIQAKLNEILGYY